MYNSMTDVPPCASFGFPPKPPFSTSPFGCFPAAPLPYPTLPPPPPPPPPMILPPHPPFLNADSYALFLERQKGVPMPFSNTGAEHFPFNNNRECTQLPYSNRYSSIGELSPNGFNAPIGDFPYPSYTEIIPFADCIGIAYPLHPGRLFAYVEEYDFANQPSIGEHPLFNKTVPRFDEDFASRPKCNKSYSPQPGTYEPHLFREIGGYHPDLQFCRYSSCGDSAKFGEYSAETAFNGFVSYSETVNILSIPSMANSLKSKTEKEVGQAADGCVLISQSQVFSQQNYTSMFRQFSIKKTSRVKQQQQQRSDKRLQD